MASTPSVVKFIVAQLGVEATSKPMFGEHGVYFGGVLIGVICDDRLFLKKTNAGSTLLGEHEEAPPYPGAKPAILVPEESWEDKALMSQLAHATATELSAIPSRKKRSESTRRRTRS